MRRRVRAPLKPLSMTNKTAMSFNREFLTFWGRFLSYRDKQQYLITPEWKNYRLLKRRIDVARYLSLFDNSELEAAESLDGYTPTEQPVHRSALVRPMLLLESIFCREPAEVAKKA